MKKLFSFFVILPFFASAQIQIIDHNRLFTDTVEYKDFNQGFLDAQKYFQGTGDYVIGFISINSYFIPAGICYAFEPKDRRFMNHRNPNINYMYSNTNYYNGYKYGAIKKKRKRLLQGLLTSASLAIGVAVYALSTL